MKAWKQTVVSAIVAEADGSKIVDLKDVAAANGINHINSQDTRDIMRSALEKLPDYKAMQIVSTPNDSLFQSLCFVQKDVEFDNGEIWSTGEI